MKKNTQISVFTDEERKKIVNKIIAFFLDERDEEIGLVAANTILDFIELEVLPITYNRAVDDVSWALKKHFEELEYKLDELKKEAL